MRASTRRPHISDAEAVQVIRDALRRRDDQRLKALLKSLSAPDGVVGLGQTYLPEAIEAEAIADAEHGNFELLAKLVEEEHHQLSPRLLKLIAARLRGEFKGKQGRPPRKQPSRNSLARSALPFIRQALRQRYGYVPRRDKIIEWTAKCYGLDWNTFSNFLKKGRRPKKLNLAP